jgi:SIR2-like protein
MPSKEVANIRRLLREAAESAEKIGDEPRVEPPGSGYFSTANSGGLEDAIDAISAHQGDITMFVGAGVSTESRLPSWNELIEQLLSGAGSGLSDEDRDLWISETISQGPLAAAAIARAHYRTEAEFRRALRSALYGGRPPASFLPGALAMQIALLKKQLQSRLRITTANYDGLLEAALSETGQIPVSYVRNRKEPAGKAAVWHLHGRLMKNAAGSGWASDGNLVLTEGDYARSTHAKWPEEFVAECLESSLCVFIGLSMTDPNFIRWLYRYQTESSREHIAVFVRQGNVLPNEAVREKLEQAAEARWRLAGVKPVWSNYFGEVAQFVHEIGLRIADPETQDFAQRASARRSMGQRNLLPQRPKSFVEAQQDLSQWLLERVEEVRSIANVLDVDLSAEDLGLGMWVADHAGGIAELWGTSEQVWLDRNAIEERPIHVATRWVGVRAIIQGVAVEEDPAVYTTRWRFIRGIPIVVQAPDRTTVGAVTLTSATPLSQSALSIGNAPGELLLAIDKMLSGSAAQFFV